MATLTTIGMIILIVIGILIVVLLGYALRFLLAIYSFFNSPGKKEDDERGNKLLRFVKSAGVIEIILYLLKNRGRFRR